MGKVSAAVLGSIIGGFAAVAAAVFYLGWGMSGQGQPAMEPMRGDYVDLLLTLVTVILAAIGVAVTAGALVIGVVALKTLREIKDEAAGAAKDAAAHKINETISTELEPNVGAKLKEALPSVLQTALLDDDLGHKILTKMAQKGELDEVVERVVVRMQGGGPEWVDEEDDRAA